MRSGNINALFNRLLTDNGKNKRLSPVVEIDFIALGILPVLIEGLEALLFCHYYRTLTGLSFCLTGIKVFHIPFAVFIRFFDIAFAKLKTCVLTLHKKLFL